MGVATGAVWLLAVGAWLLTTGVTRRSAERASWGIAAGAVAVVGALAAAFLLYES